MQWPKLYETNAALALFWKNQGSTRWGFIAHQSLRWKLGATKPRFCVPPGADKVPFLCASQDNNKLADHAGTCIFSQLKRGGVAKAKGEEEKEKE